MKSDISDYNIKYFITLLVLVSILCIMLLIVFPNQSNVLSGIASYILAIGTFFMVYIMYISYKTLAEIQKTSLEPVLAVTLWKYCYEGQEELSSFGITIKNDGLGPAKNVKLLINWALTQTIKKPGKWAKHDFNINHFYGESITDIGTIGAKEKKEETKLPIPGNLKFNDVYGVRLIATCEDIFGNKMKKYSDSKNEYLSNAEIKKFEF